MVVLEHIGLEIFEFLSAERTAVMSAHSFLNASLAVDMSAPGHKAVDDGVATNLTLELVFKLVDFYFEGGRQPWLLHDLLYIRFRSYCLIAQ